MKTTKKMVLSIGHPSILATPKTDVVPSVQANSPTKIKDARPQGAPNGRPGGGMENATTSAGPSAERATFAALSGCVRACAVAGLNLESEKKKKKGSPFLPWS
jgi:hypothetical protein